MANPRTLARLEARIHERAAYCLQFEVNDPRASFITITRVKLSTDVSSGKIFYSVLGDASDKSKAQHMLDHAAGFIQRQVARVLELRRMPRLSWVYDESAERAANIAQLISEARKRDIEINPALANEPAVAPSDPRLEHDPAGPAAPASALGEDESDDELDESDDAVDEPDDSDPRADAAH